MSDMLQAGSAQSVATQSPVESVTDLVQGLIQYGNQLLESFPIQFHYLGKDQIVRQLEELEIGLANDTVENELVKAEQCIEMLENAEIALEERKLEQEEHQEEHVTEDYLGLVMSHPEKIPFRTPGWLSIFGIKAEKVERLDDSGLLDWLYYLVSNSTLLCLAVCCLRAVVIGVGLVEGVYARYLLAMLGVVGLFLFIGTKVLRLFHVSHAANQANDMM